jgi:PAS domain S-box-containing protein
LQPELKVNLCDSMLILDAPSLILLAAIALLGALGVALLVWRAMFAGRARRNQAEHQLLLALRTLPDPFWFKDAGGRYVAWSDAFLELNGLTAEQVRGKTAREVFPAARAADIEASDAAVLASGQPVRNEAYQPIGADGRRRWTDTRKSLVRDESGAVVGIVGITRDVTARREAEEQLRAREALLRGINDNLPDGHVYQMVRAPDGTARFLYLSAGLYRIWGVRPEEAYADPGAIWARIHPDDRAAFDGAAERARETVSRFEHEMRVLRPDGEVRWTLMRSTAELLPDGSVLRNGIELDITAHKQAELALEAANRELRQRLAELSALNVIAQSLTQWVDLADALQAVSTTIAWLFDRAGVAIWQLDDQRAVLNRLAADTWYGVLATANGGAKQGAPLDHAALLVEDDPALGTLLEQPRPLVYSSTAALPPLLRAPVLPLPEARGGGLLLPLHYREQPIGLLCIRAEQPDRQFAPADIALAQTVGGVLASALDSARLLAQAQAAAAEQERRRLARELHDSVSQALYAANRTAATLPQLYELDPEEGHEALGDLQRLTAGALAEMRTLLIELRPTALVEAPLHETLGLLARAAIAKARYTLDTNLALAPLLPPEVQIALYRIAQEALNNVSKHARATHVMLRLEVTPASAAGAAWVGGVTLRVVDDGQGFEREHSGAGRIGLGSMHERAAEIGAELTLDSRPGAGTQICVAWHGRERRSGRGDKGNES